MSIHSHPLHPRNHQLYGEVLRGRRCGPEVRVLWHLHRSRVPSEAQGLDLTIWRALGTAEHPAEPILKRLA